MNQKQIQKIVPILNEFGENFTGKQDLSLDELDILALIDGEKTLDRISEDQNLSVEMFLEKYRRLFKENYLIVREPDIRYELMTFYDEYDAQKAKVEQVNSKKEKPVPTEKQLADIDEKSISHYIPEINASGVGTTSSFQFSPEEQTILLYINGESPLSEIANNCRMTLSQLVRSMDRLVLENFVFFERPSDQKKFKTIIKGEKTKEKPPEPGPVEAKPEEFDKDLIGGIIPAINVTGQGIQVDFAFTPEEQTILLYIGSNQPLGQIAKITGISLAGLVQNITRLVSANFIVIENEDQRNALKELIGDWDDFKIDSIPSEGDEEPEEADDRDDEFFDDEIDDELFDEKDFESDEERLELDAELLEETDFSDLDDSEQLEEMPEDLIDPEPIADEKILEKKPDEKLPISDAIRIKRGKWDIDSFIDMVNEIYEKKLTGRLRLLHRGGEAKNLFFDKGELINVFGKPFRPENCLGQLLMRVGKIEKDDVVDSLVGSRENMVLQGEQLVQMKKISADDLQEVLNFQLETKLDPIFLWKSGDYERLLIPKMSKKVRRIDTNLPRLLFNLMWRNADDKRIENELNNKKDDWIGKQESTVYDIEDLNFRKKFLQFWDVSIEKDIVLKRLFVISNLNKQLSGRLVWILLKLRFLLFLEDTREDLAMVRIKELSSRLLYIQNEDKFSLLGVHWSANDNGVKAGYEKVRQKLLKQVEDASPEEAKLLKQLLEIIKEAHEQVKDRDMRQKYRQEKYDETYIEINAETFRQKGESFLFTKDDYAQSIVELENAIEIWEFGTEILVVLGLSKFFLGYGKDKSLVREGRRLLQKGYDSNADKEISNVCMGMMCRKEGRKTQALSYYEKALKTNPKCRFAAIEKKEITSGKEDKDKKKAIKEFLQRRNKSDEDFNQIMAKKKELNK